MRTDLAAKPEIGADKKRAEPVLPAQRLNTFPRIEKKGSPKRGGQLVGNRQHGTPRIEPGGLIPVVIEEQAELARRLHSRRLRLDDRLFCHDRASSMNVQQPRGPGDRRIDLGESVGKGAVDRAVRRVGRIRFVRIVPESRSVERVMPDGRPRFAAQRAQPRRR